MNHPDTNPEKPSARPRRRTDPACLPPRDNRSGIALVLVLTILSILAALVISFTLTVRMERLSARNYRDKVHARHNAELAVGLGMETVDDALGPDTHYDPPAFPGRLNPFGVWFNPVDADAEVRFEQTANVLGSPGVNPIHDSFSAPIRLFDGTVTNLVPASVWEEAAPIESYWTYIVHTNDLFSTTAATNGRVAFMVIDLSGFLDAHHVTSNMLTRLPEYRDTTGPVADIRREDIVWEFSETYAEIASTYGPFFSLPDLAAVMAEGDSRTLNLPLRTLSVVSCDPGPDLFFTNNLALGTRDMEVELIDRFNLHQLHDLLSTAGSGPTRYHDILADYRHQLTNHLATAGIEAPDETAWNLINALDGHDFIPRSDSPNPWREHFGLKATPRLNEFVLFEVPSDARETEVPENFPVPDIHTTHSNHYALAVELWYPFVPHVLEAGDAQLVVGVFTNNTDEAFHRWAPEYPSDASNLSDAPDLSDTIGPFGFIQDIPPMAFDSPNDYLEFSVRHSQEDGYIQYPVVIHRFDPVIVDGVQVDWNPAAERPTETVYLPIGPYDGFPTHVSTDPAYPYEPPNPLPPGTNTVWFQARVRMREGNTSGGGAWRWVDEAFSDDSATFHPVPFSETLSEPVAWSVDDPRRNTRFSEWAREEPSLGERNPNSTVDEPHSAGLPIFIPNGPFDRIGDIGSVSLGGETNHWRTLDLTTLEGAHLLDRLTLAETNAPAYGRVHVGTTQTNVIRALLADLHIGWRNAERDAMRYLTDDELETLTQAWFEAQKLYGMGLRFAELFQAFGEILNSAPWMDEGFPECATRRDIKEQVLRGLVDRLSFRQNIFLVIGVGQTLSPARRVVAEHRIATLIVRDAYTGRWMPLRRFALDD